MGYLYGLAKLGEEGMNLYGQVRDARERSQFKDFVAENPDWADNPDKMSKAIAINPNLGMGLVDRGEAVAKQRQARAANRLMFLQRIDDAAHQKYTQALESSPGTGGEESPEGGMGAPGDVMRNYAAADKAGNDEYQRGRMLARDLYGEGFADQLPQVWKLDEYGQRRPSYERVLDSMREPVNIVFPDGKATTTALLPAELSKLVRGNPGLRITKVGSGSDIPGATHMLTAAEAEARGLPKTGRYQVDAKGAVSAAVDPEKVAGMTNDLGDRLVRDSNEFSTLQQDYGVVRSAAAAGTRAGDMTLLTKYAKMHNPGRSLGEGGYLSAQEAVQALPPWLATMYNALLSGKPTPLTNATRQELLDEAHEMYLNELGPQRERMANYKNQAEERNLPERDVLGRVVMRDKDFSERLVLPKDKTGAGPAEGAPEGPGGTVTIGEPDKPTGTVELGGKTFVIKKRKPPAKPKPEPEVPARIPTF